MDVTFCFRSESRRTTLPRGSSIEEIQRAFASAFSDNVAVSSANKFEFRVAKDLSFLPLEPEHTSNDMIIDVSLASQETSRDTMPRVDWLTSVKNIPPLLLTASPLLRPVGGNCSSNGSNSFGNPSTPSASPIAHPIIAQQEPIPSRFSASTDGYQQRTNPTLSPHFVYPAQNVPSPCLLPSSCSFQPQVNSSPLFLPSGFAIPQPPLLAPSLFSPSSSPLMAAALQTASAMVSGSSSRKRLDPDSRFVLRLRGLPWTARETEIERFFYEERILDIQIIFLSDGRASGEALVEFETHEDLCLAKTKHRQHMGHRYIEIFPAGSFDIDAVRNQNHRKMLAGTPGNDSHGFQFSANRHPNESARSLHGAHISGVDDQAGCDPTEELARTMRVMNLASQITSQIKHIAPTSDQKMSESENSSPEMEPVSDEKSAPSTYVLRLRGLPYSASRADILQFFAPVVPCSVHLIKDSNGRSSGEGYVELGCEKDAIEALQKDRQHMGHRYIEIFQSSATELALALGVTHEGALNVLTRGSNAQLTCVLMRGLPYESTETDIAKFFLESGITPSKIHRKSDGGEAYVEFRSVDDVEKAMERNKHYIGHRYVELFRVSYADMAATVGIPNPPTSNPVVSGQQWQYNHGRGSVWGHPRRVSRRRMDWGTYLQLLSNVQS